MKYLLILSMIVFGYVCNGQFKIVRDTSKIRIPVYTDTSTATNKVGSYHRTIIFVNDTLYTRDTVKKRWVYLLTEANHNNQ